MTSDLYYTQLSEIQELTVSDTRTENCMEQKPDFSELNSSNLIFYSEITKSEKSEKWITTIHIFNPNTGIDKSKQSEYDSFYKILMESKNTLKETINNLLDRNEAQTVASDSFIPSSIASITSTEALAGTWGGENFVDKIIIMKGGRGFVIFNNGASMNILVEIDNSAENQKILISQRGRTNASFYPNLPRNIAVNAALEAEPLEWYFNLSDNNTLSGTKKALVQNGESFSYITENVQWNRIQ